MYLVLILFYTCAICNVKDIRNNILLLLRITITNKFDKLVIPIKRRNTQIGNDLFSNQKYELFCLQNRPLRLIIKIACMVVFL